MNTLIDCILQKQVIRLSTDDDERIDPIVHFRQNLILHKIAMFCRSGKDAWHVFLWSQKGYTKDGKPTNEYNEWLKQNQWAWDELFYKFSRRCWKFWTIKKDTKVLEWMHKHNTECDKHTLDYAYDICEHDAVSIAAQTKNMEIIAFFKKRGIYPDWDKWIRNSDMKDDRCGAIHYDPHMPRFFAPQNFVYRPGDWNTPTYEFSLNPFAEARERDPEGKNGYHYW